MNLENRKFNMRTPEEKEQIVKHMVENGFGKESQVKNIMSHKVVFGLGEKNILKMGLKD